MDDITLDYRLPQTGGPRVQRVMAELVQMETTSWLAVAGKIALAIPLCLLGPFLLTVGIFRWGQDEFTFPQTFLLITVVLLPILLWYARYNSGDVSSDALSGIDRPSSYGEYEMNRYAVISAVWTGFAILGRNWSGMWSISSKAAPPSIPPSVAWPRRSLSGFLMRERRCRSNKYAGRTVSLSMWRPRCVICASRRDRCRAAE